ncbi:Uma2 family endonuclease [soil metagenome]
MSALPDSHLLTADQFEHMIELGVFAPEDRLELVDGEIVRISPIGPRHFTAVQVLQKLFFSLISDTRVFVGSQGTMRGGVDFSPEPDVALLKPSPTGYDRFPDVPDIFLLIEVADSTLAYDRNTKLPRYAAAGIPELWIVNLVANVVEVYRDPIPGEMRYATKVVAGAADFVSPLAFPDVSLPVSAIIIN